MEHVFILTITIAGRNTGMGKTVALSCLALAGGMLLSNPCTSQELHSDLPTNAHFSAGGQGWACNDGFRQVAQLCVLDTHGAVDRGAFEVFSGEWRCRTGYRGHQARIAVLHPVNVGQVQQRSSWSPGASPSSPLTPPTKG